jgi:uncharacterized membrane protein HdeD (DUF308 family)
MNTVANTVMNSGETQLATVLSRNWWVLLLRGLIAIVFRVWAWLQPGISLAALVFFFGALHSGGRHPGGLDGHCGTQGARALVGTLLLGLVGIGVGVLTFVAPGVTAVALLLYIAIWAIATAVLEIVTALRLRREIEGEWCLILAGFASVVFGALLIARPAADALAVLWLIATYAVIFGVLLVILAFKARTFGNRLARS